MAINTEELTKEEKVSYWQDRVSAWETSGLSQAEYCRRDDLKMRNFGYWKRRLHKTSEPVTFVPLRVQKQHPHGTPLELVLDGFRIEVNAGFSPSTLKELILTLRQL